MNLALSRGVRALCGRITFCLVAFLIAAQFCISMVQAAEPPPKQAYHVSVLNGSIVGSAFMIDAGLMVTNAHVVAGRRIGDRIALLAPTGRQVTARLQAVSTQMDLAVLSVDGTPTPVVPHSPRHMVRGAQVVAVGIVARSGNPRQRHIIRGIVSSATHSLEPFGPGVIARMPSVQKGFSGGPVFDQNGDLVGMIAALRSEQASPSGRREAFILLAAEIRAEIARLVGR